MATLEKRREYGTNKTHYVLRCVGIFDGMPMGELYSDAWVAMKKLVADQKERHESGLKTGIRFHR